MLWTTILKIILFLLRFCFQPMPIIYCHKFLNTKEPPLSWNPEWIWPYGAAPAKKLFAWGKHFSLNNLHVVIYLFYRFSSTLRLPWAISRQLPFGISVTVKPETKGHSVSPHGWLLLNGAGSPWQKQRSDLCYSEVKLHHLRFWIEARIKPSALVCVWLFQL